jgi:hypothetical protein
MNPTTELPETTVTARGHNGISVQGPRAGALCLPGNPCLDVDCPAPLPGVIIFVHGVNSMGEWFDTSKESVCKGLKPTPPITQWGRTRRGLAHPRAESSSAG